MARIADILVTVADRLNAPDTARVDWGRDTASTRAAQPPTVALSTAAGPLPATAGADKLDGISETAQKIGKKLIALSKILRLSPSETQQLADLSGNIVELDQRLDIDIDPDGETRLSYRHELFNMSSRPLTRLARELWFESTSGPLAISPVQDGERRIVIQRIHYTGNLAKFACQISPPVQPGESAVLR